MKFFSFLIVIAFTLMQIGCMRDAGDASDERSAPERGVDPVQLTDENFEREVLKSGQPVLVDMWAQWCRPCIKLKPTIRELAAEFSGEAKVGELDVDANPFIAEKYGIERYPTLIVFDNGQETERLVGVKTREELAELLRTVAGSSGRPR